MNVHVFKPSNEHIGKLKADGFAEIPSKLSDFVASHKEVPLYSYVEADGKSWTITGLDPFQLQEGRIWSATTYSSESSNRPVSSAGSQASSSVVTRYRDAYRVGAALVGLGTAIKIVRGILAGVIVLGSLALPSEFREGKALLAGVFVAAIVGLLFWVSGVVIAALGQILRATLDSAVASSHFLTDLERADAMGLSRSVVDRSAA